MNSFFSVSYMSKIFSGIFVIANIITFSAIANDGLKVIASVNGDVITSYDVKLRSDFMTKILDNSEGNNSMINRYNKQNISASVVDDLIKERLKISESKRYTIDATEAEVKKAISYMNKSFRLPDGKLESIMSQVGCSDKMYVKNNLDVCFQMFYADVVWSKFSGMFFGALVPVDEKEMDDELKKYKDYISFAVNDLNISQIVLSDKKSADNLYDELQKSSVKDCKKFDAIGEEKGVAGSGNLGYLKLQETSQIVGEHIRDLDVGMASRPLKNVDGEYYIYLICSKKIDEKLKDKIPSFDEMQGRISNAMMAQKVEAFATKYLEKLFNTAFIEYM